MVIRKNYRPNKAEEFAQMMSEMNDFCRKNHIDFSSSSDSYYFTLYNQKYRVSNHSVEASNRNSGGLWHSEGRKEDTIYIHASKARIKEIYNNIKDGCVLDGRGDVKMFIPKELIIPYYEANGSFSSSQLAEYAKSPSPAVQTFIAKQENTDSEVLNKLSYSMNIEVRRAVASNKNADVKTLERLSLENDYNLLSAIVHNNKANEFCLRNIADISRSSDNLLSAYVAKHKNASAELLDELVRGKNSYTLLLSYAVENKNISVDTLKFLLQNNNYGIRHSAEKRLDKIQKAQEINQPQEYNPYVIKPKKKGLGI